MTPLDFMALFPEFRGPSWDGWRTVLARLTDTIREFYAIVGRGAGKSRIVALLAVCFAVREYRRAPGEHIYVGIFAPDRRQARVTFRYVRGLLGAVPELATLIESETQDSLTLATGVIVEVLTASVAAPRGRAYALAIVEEASFLPNDQSANPDVELLRALRPALARVPGSLLAVVSSAYARRGVLWAAWQKYHGQPDGPALLIKAPTLELNPTFDAEAVRQAYEDDPLSASAEYGAEFRADVEAYIDPDAADAVIVTGRYELAPVSSTTYVGFLDFAGGAPGGDSAVLAIAHAEQVGDRTVAVLDLVRERKAPFSPEEVCGEFSDVLQGYRVTRATADRWAGQFPVEQMAKAKWSVQVDPSELSKSDIYRDCLPLINSARVELLDVPRLRAQLVALERRTARGGRDSIDHPPGGKDDVINAASGALVKAALMPAKAVIATIGQDAWHGRGGSLHQRCLQSMNPGGKPGISWQDQFYRR